MLCVCIHECIPGEMAGGGGGLRHPVVPETLELSKGEHDRPTLLITEQKEIDGSRSCCKAPGPMGPPDSKRSDHRVGLTTKARMTIRTEGSNKQAKTGKDSQRERARRSSSRESMVGKGETEKRGGGLSRKLSK